MLRANEELRLFFEEIPGGGWGLTIFTMPELRQPKNIAPIELLLISKNQQPPRPFRFIACRVPVDSITSRSWLKSSSSMTRSR
jgi:hypothetical protein